MIISSSGENIKYINDNSVTPKYTICGNIKTEYIEDLKVYIISRIDGKVFDGSECLDIAYTKEKISGIDKIVEHEINIFSLFQNNVEAIMFDKFYYYMSSSLKYIIVEPIFEKREGVDMYLPIENTEEIRLSKHKIGIKKTSF